jgi:hypothetical protein
MIVVRGEGGREGGTDPAAGNGKWEMGGRRGGKGGGEEGGSDLWRREVKLEMSVAVGRSGTRSFPPLLLRWLWRLQGQVRLGPVSRTAVVVVVRGVQL